MSEHSLFDAKKTDVPRWTLTTHAKVLSVRRNAFSLGGFIGTNPLNTKTVKRLTTNARAHSNFMHATKAEQQNLNALVAELLTEIRDFKEKIAARKAAKKK